MKKILKGCLTIIIIGILFIVAIVMYLNSPNDIKFVKQPISYKTISNDLGGYVPQLITEMPKSSILYQSVLVSNGLMDKTVTYKQVMKTSNKIKLDNKLPIRQIDLDKVNKNVFLPDITNNPLYIFQNDKEIPSSNSLTIFSKVDSVYMKLQNGSYSIDYYEIDKEGAFAEEIIYDDDSKLLYITKVRYFAFQ